MEESTSEAKKDKTEITTPVAVDFPIEPGASETPVTLGDLPTSSETLSSLDPSTLKTNRKRVARRRSSIGIQIINSFLGDGAEETMSPVEPKVRPRRSAKFDIGERAAVKSCMKPWKGSNLVEKTASVSKSITQQAAERILKKYRKSGERTPTSSRAARLRFHKICSIRVITPRPGYDPEHPELPHSDDDSNGKINPNRERLSTVELRLTPTSQSHLEKIQDGEIVQFNAEMVFGDGESFLSASSSRENVAEAAGVVPTKKKRNRRKSLIIGSDIPLPFSKIEELSIDDSIESEPGTTRKLRRSLRLGTGGIGAILNSHEKLCEQDDSKKRDMASDSAGREPQPKRSRQKCGFVTKENKGTVSEKKQIALHSFFAPRASKKPDETISKSKEAIRKGKKTTRRSSSYLRGNDEKDALVPSVQNYKIEDSEIIVVSPPRESSAIPCSSSNQNSELYEKEEVTIIATTSSSSTSTTDIVASTPMRESAVLEDSQSSKKRKMAAIFSKPRPHTISDVEANEGTPSTSKNPKPKMFSLFSPKPKVDSSPAVTIPSIETPVFESSINVKSMKKTVGIRRMEHWGDKHPEEYSFMLKMPRQPCIFEKETSRFSDDKIFNSRPFDNELFTVGNVDSQLRELNSEVPNLLFNTEDDDYYIEKFPVPEKSYATTVYPTKMDYLVEGAEEGEMLAEWLTKWKRRVRKDIKRELAKEKEKKNNSSKGRRRKDADDYSDEEYELEKEDCDLENPLVLIGPTGVGKTALIRALAKQENMRIISIGPETDRTGTEIKKKLYEAMRSHRVDQLPEHRLLTFFKTVSQSTFMAKNENSEMAKEYTHSLIVFEHVDVFFDTFDRNGVSGLLEVLNDAAVPVVFTCENDFPRSFGSTQLRRRHLEIRLCRDEVKVQKYVQKVVYSCRNLFISDATMRQLSESVNHDLQALLHQAHFFSLSPDRPLPLTSRRHISNGFDHEWEKPRRCLNKAHERMDDLFAQYVDVLPDGIVKISHPRIELTWDTERFKLASKQSGFSESVQNAYDALNGRFSRQDLIKDVLPMLVPMDRIERKKKARSRRHLHRFKQHSGIPMDGDLLIDVVGGWSMNLV